jgi:asparagine synthetase B (glutamine-hydrolysing)
MCSFLILLNKLYGSLNKYELLKYLKMRGPDETNVLNFKEYTFIHNLLHICGKKTLQPFFSNNIIALLNGEIYNYKDFDSKYESDGECIIDLYEKYGQEFSKKLYGEFAIVIFDYNKNKIILCSDIFSTKPLFYYYDPQLKFIISSLRRTIVDNIKNVNVNNLKKLEANTCISLDFENNLIEKNNIYDFDLKQYKTNYDDFIRALENAINIRICNNNNNNKHFICLSSGYDSGVISLVLKNMNHKFRSYTILAKDSKEIIDKRLNFDKTYNDNTYIELTNKLYAQNKDYVNKNIDDYEINYKIYKDVTCERNGNFKRVSWRPSEDAGTIGINHIFNLANKEGYRIYLSGHGADEIFCDYGAYNKGFVINSQLKGYYPQNLNDVFPWNNFYEGTMKMFISKEEGIGSLYGIETRYPFLDKYVVQEFLNLSQELKNNSYKGPLSYYMKKYNYPFEEDIKIGFKCNKRLKD